MMMDQKKPTGKGMPTALTIAGSDCSGGAGIQADIKTMTMHGVYAMSAVTALTAQNTTGVSDIKQVSPEFLGCQLDMVFQDIRPDAVKVGMLPGTELMAVTADRLRSNEAPHVVIDPVMIASSGVLLSDVNAIREDSDDLFSQAELITPNIPEAENLTGMSISTLDEMADAATVLQARYGCSVLVKGGHVVESASDVLVTDFENINQIKISGPDAPIVRGNCIWYPGTRIDNPNTHGTGCTLSSAIASGLALGKPLVEAVYSARNYVRGALSAMLDLGAGSGPLNHAYLLNEENINE